jgi:hypothetical protein
MHMPRKVLKSRTITIDDYYAERFLRIETELSHQREMIKIGIDTMNNRFDALRDDINRRFEASDRRFDALTSRMDRFMIWSFSMTVATSGLILTAIRYWK